MILYFIIAMLVIGTIFEMVLHRKELNFVKSQLAAAEVGLECDTELLGALLEDQTKLHQQCLASQRVADAGDRQVVIYHDRNVALARDNESLRRTVANLEQSVLLLSNELDEQQIAYARQVLSGNVLQRDAAQQRLTGGNDA